MARDKGAVDQYRSFAVKRKEGQESDRLLTTENDQGKQEKIRIINTNKINKEID
jgi:hypothetical protein